MSHLATALALLIAASGWFYLFYSRGAHKLAGIEAAADNRARVIFRRANGVCMLALAVCFFMGFNTFDPKDRPNAFVTTWFAVFLLLGTTMVLALIDVRLTVRLRRRREAEMRRDVPPNDE